jgi:hypothetical protein
VHTNETVLRIVDKVQTKQRNITEPKKAVKKGLKRIAKCIAKSRVNLYSGLK